MRALAPRRTLSLHAVIAVVATIGASVRSAAAEVPAPDRAEQNEREHEREGEDAEAEKRLSVGLDLVLGAGKVDVVDQGRKTPQSGVGPQIDKTQATTFSSVLGGEYEVGHGLSAGLRVPFLIGSLDASTTRGAEALGNIEIEGGYRLELARMAEIEVALGVALPTAQGSSVPDDPSAVTVTRGSFDASGYDRGALQRAVAMSRGYEENALFEMGHLGIVPKIQLEAHDGAWHVDPYVKVENLIATAGGGQSYTGELVLGVTAGYAVAKQVEPALRLWTNVPLANTDFAAVAVGEPQLRLHFGAVTPVLGVILPFAGPLTSPYEVGVRFSVGARF